MCGGQTIPCLDRCLAHGLDLDQNGDCLPQNPLRDCLIVLDVRSDIISILPLPPAGYWFLKQAVVLS